MGKLSKVVVCGQVASGKTALIEQLIYGNHVVGAVSVLLIYQSISMAIMTLFGALSL